MERSWLDVARSGSVAEPCITITTESFASMSHLLVYATAESRLHADLVIVRLKTAGISIEQLSLFYPPVLRPNSARCWVNGTALVPLSSTQSISVSGSLSRVFNGVHRKNKFASLSDGMRALGLNDKERTSLEDSLRENRIIVAIHVLDEYELPSIYHTLRGLAVEKACVVDVYEPGAAVPARSHRYHPEFVPAANSAGYFAAA